MSFFSIIPDLLPMILPSAVQVTKGDDLEQQRADSEVPMIRQGAVIGKSDKMCATVLVAKPHCASAVHHHGEEDTIIYAAKGRGILVTKPKLSEPDLKRHELSPGDFAFVPPWTEHQELNETDEEVVWILIRSGPEPVVVYLSDWGGDQVNAD